MFDINQLQDMQAEMQRLLADYPDGNIPDEKIREWEAKQAAQTSGKQTVNLDNADELKAAIAADETHMRADKAPRDVEIPKQLSKADARLVKDLASLYALLGMGVNLLDSYDGMLIISGAEDRARELVQVANHHPAMKRTLKQLTQSNDYIALAVGHGAIALAIAQHHGWIPGNLLARVTGAFQATGPQTQPESVTP